MDLDILSEIRSPEFDCSKCIYELCKHRNNIGVHFILVEKLAGFSYRELEFFIPQLVQILVSFETESMALHDLILDFSKKYPHFCLLTFWNLQAYVFELKNQPDSYSFHVVRSFINSLQDIMFNQEHEAGQSGCFRENIHPAMMMCAAVGASLAIPGIHQYCKPMIVSQGRQQKSFLFRLANFHSTLTKNLTLKNRGTLDFANTYSTEKGGPYQDGLIKSHQRYSESVLTVDRHSLRNSVSGVDSDSDDVFYNSDYSQDHKIQHRKMLHPKRPMSQKLRSNEAILSLSPSTVHKYKASESIGCQSLPDLTSESQTSEVVTLGLENYDLPIDTLVLSPPDNNTNISEKSREDSIWALKANYYRKEMEFMMVLQNISSRLSQVPKEARLTSLRAELSILNNALLPSQIDIPQLFPASNFPNRRFHRILKLNISEACVLNSAERVPFLLLIEYLSEDMDFDPSSDYNKQLLTDSSLKKKIDLRSSKLKPPSEEPFHAIEDSGNEADLGDISIVNLSNQKSHFLDYLRANMTECTNSWSMPKVLGGISPAQYPRESRDLNTRLESVKTRDLSAQIRIAAVMLKQLEKSGQANSDQSVAIKTRIINSMESLQNQFDRIDYQQIREISAVKESSEPDAGERKVENDFKLGEDWAIKRARIRKTSQFGHLPNWDLCSVIVKNGDDLQQEAFACQLISVISNFWKQDKIGVWTKNMKIVITSFNSGLVETINNALSIHSIKKTMTELSIKNGENPKGMVASVKDYFKQIYGPESSAKYSKAQESFARSLAAYSIICYVLQIKDRHNGNIMLDSEGHIIHIDFGFMLSNSPGSVGFEAAPFKLTTEYIDLLGGLQSRFFKTFVDLCKECFLSLRRNHLQLVNLVDLMQKDSGLPCFKNGPQTTVLLKQRLQLDLSEEECNKFVETGLIGKSAGSVYTRLYDQFQLLTQGIYS